MGKGYESLSHYLANGDTKHTAVILCFASMSQPSLPEYEQHKVTILLR